MAPQTQDTLLSPRVTESMFTFWRWPWTRRRLDLTQTRTHTMSQYLLNDHGTGQSNAVVGKLGANAMSGEWSGQNQNEGSSTASSLWRQFTCPSPECVGLAVRVMLLVLCGTTGSIVFKKMTNHVHYPYVLSLLVTTFGLPVYVCKLAWDTYKGDVDWEVCSRFPKRRFLLPAFLDSIGGLFLVFGGSGTIGPLQTLLYQLCIPITMIATYVILRRRFARLQYIASMIIMAGVLCSMTDHLSDASHKGGSQDNSLFWNVMYIAGIVPLALSSVFKERIFCQENLDIFYVQVWVSFFQLICGICLAPLNAIPALGGVSLGTLPTTVYDALMCVFDFVSCEHAFLYVTGYALANCAYNILGLSVVKKSSAALMITASTIRLPLTNIAFHLSFIMGAAEVAPFSPYDVGGFAVILFGIMVYRYGEGRKQMATEVPVGLQQEVRELEMTNMKGPDTTMPLHVSGELIDVEDPESIGPSQLLLGLQLPRSAQGSPSIQSRRTSTGSYPPLAASPRPGTVAAGAGAAGAAAAGGGAVRAESPGIEIVTFPSHTVDTLDEVLIDENGTYVLRL
eukprot:GFYU01001900.1.p1 GENE.GFYU01001900.1~~GFYU01001900.1.p1  ORF type:complete len:566 (+),score=100.73 GFYU01001900.1:445-2142(+)